MPGEQPHRGREGVHRRVHPGPRVGEHQPRARLGLDVAALTGGVDLAPPPSRHQPFRRREARAVVEQLAEPDERAAQQVVVGPERVERRGRPFEEVLASFLRQPDQIGDHADAVGLGEVGDGVERAPLDEVGDHRLGPGGDGRLVRRQGPRDELGVQHLAARVVERRVGRQDAATRLGVHRVVHADAPRRREALPVLEHGPHLVVAGQRVRPVLRHPDHGSELAQLRVRGVRDRPTRRRPTGRRRSTGRQMTRRRSPGRA